jgi:hypothetical protein
VFPSFTLHTAPVEDHADALCAGTVAAEVLA